MASWLDKMLSRIRDAKDEDQARSVVADYIDPTTGERKAQPGEEGDTHIHVHMPGKGGEGGGAMEGDEDLPADPDTGGGAPDITELAARVAALEEQVESLLGEDEEDVDLEGENEDGTKDVRRFKLRRRSKLRDTKDQDVPVPERNPDLMGETDLPGLEDLDKRMASGDKKTRDAALKQDSADMDASWEELTAAAEIIVPGIRTPTFDARLPVYRTAQRMCSHRRVVLDKAMKDAATAELIAETTGIKNAQDFRVMACDTVKMAFNATANAIRDRNNAGSVRRSVGDIVGKDPDGNKPKGPPPISQMNKDAKEFWKGKTFH
jgi:hypothetical protein